MASALSLLEMIISPSPVTGIFLHIFHGSMAKINWCISCLAARYLLYECSTGDKLIRLVCQPFRLIVLKYIALTKFKILSAFCAFQDDFDGVNTKSMTPSGYCSCLRCSVLFGKCRGRWAWGWSKNSECKSLIRKKLSGTKKYSRDVSTFELYWVTHD